MGEAFFFYLFSTLTFLSALYVVTTRRPVYAVLSLVATMFSLAVLFVLLKAYFIAAVHVLVYAGAILVLFLFVVMLLGVSQAEIQSSKQRMLRIFGGLTTLALLVEIGLVAKAVSRSGTFIRVSALGTIEGIGRLLFTQYILPFEITSVLLLVGIVGAVVLARKESA